MTTDLSNLDPTGRFSGLAKVYAKARPSYPDSAIDFIVTKCALSSNSLIADIGCGTGISSRLFAKRGIAVLGIEPNDEMRKSAQSENESAPIEGLRYLKATAEHTELQDASVDLVLAAQAFHWFRAEPTLKEFQRIIKPGGWCALMWNERDDSDTFTNEYSKLLHALPNTASVEMKRGVSGVALLESDLFSEAQKVLFANEQIVDKDGLLARAFSASYVPQKGEVAEKFAHDLRALFARCAKGGKVAIKYETSVYLAKR